MGELRQRGRIWWMRYYRNGQRFEESARTTKYEEARDQLRRKEGQIADGVPVSPKTGRLRFEDAMASVLNDYVIKRAQAPRSREAPDRSAPHAVLRWTTADENHDRSDRGVHGRSAEGWRIGSGSEPRIGDHQTDVLAGDEGQSHPQSALRRDAGRTQHPEGVSGAVAICSREGHLPAALQPLLEFGYLTGWRLASEVMGLEWRNVDWQGRMVRLDPRRRVARGDRFRSPPRLKRCSRRSSPNTSGSRRPTGSWRSSFTAMGAVYATSARRG